MSSPLVYPVSVAALLGGLVAGLLIRLRWARDRRAIITDLEKHRCRLVSVRTALGRWQPFGGRTYHVEYLDDEADAAQATCIVARGGVVSWEDDFLDIHSSAAFAHDLPTYGQNWRG